MPFLPCILCSFSALCWGRIATLYTEIIALQFVLSTLTHNSPLKRQITWPKGHFILEKIFITSLGDIEAVLSSEPRMDPGLANVFYPQVTLLSQELCLGFNFLFLPPFEGEIQHFIFCVDNYPHHLSAYLPSKPFMHANLHAPPHFPSPLPEVSWSR